MQSAQTGRQSKPAANNFFTSKAKTGEKAPPFPMVSGRNWEKKRRKGSEMLDVAFQDHYTGATFQPICFVRRAEHRL